MKIEVLKLKLAQIFCDHRWTTQDQPKPRHYTPFVHQCCSVCNKERDINRKISKGDLK